MPPILYFQVETLTPPKKTSRVDALSGKVNIPTLTPLFIAEKGFFHQKPNLLIASWL